MATLTLIRGLPGAGKSTYAKQHFDCLILENDMWHVEDGCYSWTKDKLQAALKWVYKTAELMLENGKDVCIANTFTRKAFINSYKLLAEKHHAQFNVVRLETQFKSVHAVPDEVVKSMKDSFEDWPGEVIISQHEDRSSQFPLRLSFDRMTLSTNYFRKKESEASYGQDFE